MRAAVLTRYGNAEHLELRDVPRPTAGAGRVLVRVRATAVNDWDWSIVSGESLITRLSHGILNPKNAILGLDVAGEVVEVGPGVTTFAPGDRVFGDLSSAGFGGFAEFVAPEASALRHMPAGIDFVDAAALPHAANLAMQAVALAKLEPGDRLLLNGAAGGVGTFALQLALDHCLTNMTGVDSAPKLDFLRAQGIETALDYRAVDFTGDPARRDSDPDPSARRDSARPDPARRQSEGRDPARYDVIIDARTTRSPFRLARALADGGRYVTVGGPTVKLLGVVLWRGVIRRRTGKQLEVVFLRTNHDTDAAAALYTAGTLRPQIDSIWPLAETAQAVARFGRGEHRGKIVIRVD
jgi:NADPH:quinone reductase-like Zn-dependent oxidoreductase